jgi:hypothetical protein
VLPSFASTWPNWFHHLTDEATIRRELLLPEGTPYRLELVEESMRNLRDLGIFALVRIVAVQTGDPARVDLLVYTRDMWSLRLEQNFAGAGDSVQLAAQLVERNFLGRNKVLAGRFSFAPDVYSFGQTYADPRVFGQDLRLIELFDLIFSRAGGGPEGSTGTLRFGRPYYSLAQQFSFELYAKYADFVDRKLRNGRLLGYDTRPESRGESCVPGSEGCVGRVWDEWRLRVELAAHHRIGQRSKQIFTAGLGVADQQASPNRETRLLPAQERVFRAEVLPRVRRDVYPFVRYRLSLPSFATFTNLGTFGQSESVQLGPRIDGSVALPLRLLGSTGNGMEVHGLLGYSWAVHDTFVDVVADVTSRLDRGKVRDQRALLQLRAASPPLSWVLGRFVGRALWDGRKNDTQNTLVTLGADNGLRGYPAQYLYGTGASRILCNLEYRTQPWLLQSVHLGLVGFYDAGTVYEELRRARWRHALGAGVRVLFPQFNRYAFRLDVGAPLGAGGFSVLVSYGSDQVVPLTPAQDLLAESGVGLNLD